MPTGEQQTIWLTDLHFFAPHLRTYTVPLVHRTLFTTTAKSLDFAARRMEALTALRGDKQVIVVATAAEAAQHVVSPGEIDAAVLTFAVNEEYARETVLAGLAEGGYERTELVDRRGCFSVRGDIIDVYPLNEERAVRIEFSGIPWKVSAISTVRRKSPGSTSIPPEFYPSPWPVTGLMPGLRCLITAKTRLLSGTKETGRKKN